MTTTPQPWRTTVLEPVGNGFYRVPDLDFSTPTYLLIPTEGRSVASMHLRCTGWTRRASAVATVIVSNDVLKADYADHPAGITLGSSTVTPPFACDYGFVGVRVSTVEANVKGELFVRLSP